MGKKIFKNLDPSFVNKLSNIVGHKSKTKDAKKSITTGTKMPSCDCFPCKSCVCIESAGVCCEPSREIDTNSFWGSSSKGRAKAAATVFGTAVRQQAQRHAAGIDDHNALRLADF